MISAEVMQVGSQDGRIQIQTRNLKYGKLINGFLVKTDPNFIRRMKNHIVEFFGDSQEFSIGCIVGTNGYVWIYSPTQNTKEGQVPALKSISLE